MRKKYVQECTSEYLYREAHTVKTIDGMIFVNLWNGEYISRSDPSKKLAVHEIYLITKNVEKDNVIVASRTELKFPLRFIAKPISINKK